MSMEAPKHIVLAVEAAELAEPALSKIAELAKATTAVVDLLNVWEPIPFTPPDAAYYQNEGSKSYRDIATEHGSQELAALAERAAEEGVRIGVEEVREGAPAQTIAEFAKERSADLIVVVSHQRKGAYRWLQGSVSEKVAKVAACPVLVVPTK